MIQLLESRFGRRILDCRDLDRLSDWFDRALGADSLDALGIPADDRESAPPKR